MTRKHPFVRNGGIFIMSSSHITGGDCLMPTIVHFDVPAEDIERAKKFYSTLLGWKFESFPEMQYNLITTTNLDGTPGVGGGMGKRMEPSQRMMNYFGVPSIECRDETGQKPRWKNTHGKDGSAPDGLPCQLR